MSSRSRWKLLSVLIVASAILGVVCWQQFLTGPMSPTTMTITPSATRVTATQTAVTPQRQTEWIRIGEVKPVDYYLSLLESNRTAPYGQLFWELRKLPELTNATAVAKITYLALNATNPEVKEAFELMMKGGTPSPGDYAYKVPEYNTELQVLYWLACQNEFKKDDTLSLAVAMANGLWVTVGDEQVTEAVQKDTSEFLAFFRDTNDIRKKQGYRQLEDYPIEAKLCLVWSGSAAVYMNWPGHSLSGADRRDESRVPKANIRDYAWDTVSVQTLVEMQRFMIDKDWFKDDTDLVNQLVESYFYLGGRSHWDNPTDPGNLGGLRPETPILIDGEEIRPRNFWNVDLIWSYFGRTGRGIGVCADNSAFVDALNKAIGIPTTSNGVVWVTEGEAGGHGFVAYYVANLKCWKSHTGQMQIRTTGGPLRDTQIVHLQLFIPPWNQRGYLKWKYEHSRGFFETPAFYAPQMKFGEVQSLFSGGAPTSQMKQWLFYS